MNRKGDHFVLRVDPILCDGFAHCHELAPELVQVDEWGYPIIHERPTPISERRTLEVGPVGRARLSAPGPANRTSERPFRGVDPGARFWSP